MRIPALLLSLLLAGCATTVNTDVKVSAEHVAKYSELSALDVVAALEKNVNEARKADMPFLAPHYFREAARILGECQSGLGSAARETLVNNAAKGDAVLEKGRAVMAIVQYRFAQELELRKRLDALNTEKLLPKEYSRTIAELSRLIEKVEGEQASDIDKDKAGLLKTMQELEIKAVQEGALHESEAINTDSRKQLADKQVPLTYAEALRVFQEARNQIAAAPHDEKLVRRVEAEALFAARHAQQLNERVTLLQAQLKMISSGSSGAVSLSGGVGGSLAGAQLATQGESKPAAMDKVTVERIALQEEERLLGISAALGLKDLRDRALDKQVEEIKRVAAGERSPQPKADGGGAATREMEARLAAAEAATRQALDELASKERQLKEATQQLQAQSTQLADKDAQIKVLQDKVVQLEDTAKQSVASKPVTKPKAAKKAKPATPEKK